MLLTPNIAATLNANAVPGRPRDTAVRRNRNRSWNGCEERNLVGQPPEARAYRTVARGCDARCRYCGPARLSRRLRGCCRRETRRQERRSQVGEWDGGSPPGRRDDLLSRIGERPKLAVAEPLVDAGAYPTHDPNRTSEDGHYEGGKCE
jgi:hypothetical protein